MPTRVLKKKHFWHGLLFLAVGVFMFGTYFGIGDAVETESVSLGPVVAIALMGFGAFLLWAGQKLLERDSVFIEYYDAIVMAVGVALVVRTFIVEPFKIPSGSMIPTLLVGDYLFVNKNAYGYRVPYTSLRVFMGAGPQRGDVVVFRYPPDPGKDYIKRVVGLPGDHIRYQNKHLTINGEAVPMTPGGTFTYPDQYGRPVEAALFRETLGEHEHAVLLSPFGFGNQTVEETVPAGHYFVMGDNRDNSSDSRAWGFVPASHLVGRAVALFYSWDAINGGVRWERLGNSLN